MKFSLAIVALLGSVSSFKLARRDVTIEDAANSFGDTRTAGKQISTHQELTYRLDPNMPSFATPTNSYKIQRDPAFTFSGPHSQYHSNSSTGNAGQAGEQANGGTLTRGALGA